MKKRKIDNRMIKSSDELYKEKGKKTPEIWLEMVKTYKIKKIMFF